MIMCFKFTTKVTEWLRIDGIHPYDLNLNPLRSSASGLRMCFLTFSTREGAIEAWNILRTWWFWVPDVT